MRAAERESLVLRQVAALSRSGLPRDQALAAAAEGLPAGELASRIAGARRTLREGRGDDVFGGEPEGLELAARALDAELEAVEVVRTVRHMGAVAVLVPLVMMAVAPLLAPAPPELGGPMPGTWVVLGWMSRLAWLGLPLAALGWWGIGQAATRWSPGVRQLRAAAQLLRGVSPVTGLGDDDALYLELRREVAGDVSARADVAAELVDEAERQLAWFQAFAPPVAAAVVLWLFGVLAVLVFSPLFAMAGSV